MIRRLSSFRHRSTRPGFSLPEVAISVAILSLSLLTLLGLIPSVMDNMRQASSRTAETRIVSEITGAINLADWGVPSAAPYHWNNLSTILDRRWYFDDQANPIAANDPDFNMRVSYVARARLASEPGGGSTSHGEVVFPAPAGSSLPTVTNAKAVQVLIASSTRKDFAFDDPTKYSAYLTVVARQF
jgi:uncharacterized protein (TIGR02598 family)